MQIIDKGQYRYRNTAPATQAQTSPLQVGSAPADQGPHHLAQTVERALSVSGQDAPSADVLISLFSALYEASFRAEHGGTLRGRIVWQNADAPSSGHLALAVPVPLSAGSLGMFLSGAAAPPAALLVGPGETHPVIIHGILAGGPAPVPPALLTAQILGPAHLKVEAGLDYPLELRRNRLRVSTQKVLERGLVRARLAALFQPLFPAVQARLPADVASSPLLSAGSFPLPGGSVLLQEQDWPETLEQFWVSALALLLRRIDDMQRGGCVLLVPRREPSSQSQRPGETWLLPPHDAAFPQLRQALESCAAAAVTQQVQAVQSLAGRTGSPRDLPPDDLALQEPCLPQETLISDPEITGAVRLLAPLACMDGPLRLDPSLALIGFGGQPDAAALPERIYLAGDEAATDLTPISSRSFGPRNQALLNLCRQNPDGVGFALTQEGDLRAMLWHEDKLIVWNTALLPPG